MLLVKKHYPISLFQPILLILWLKLLKQGLLFLLHVAVTMLKMAGDVIVSALWRLKISGAIMVRWLFVSIKLEGFWWSTMQSYQKLQYLNKVAGLTMGSVTWYWFPIKNLLDWFKLLTCVETSYLNTDMRSLNHCKEMKAEPIRLIP